MGRDYLFRSEKKRIWKSGSFYAVIALFVAFAVFTAHIADEKTGEEKTSEIAADNIHISEETEKTDEKDNNSTKITDDSGEYYLLKENNGIIELYHYDAEGEETLLRVTEIPFSLISESDRRQFTEGMIIDSEEELDEILQDFES